MSEETLREALLDHENKVVDMTLACGEKLEHVYRMTAIVRKSREALLVLAAPADAPPCSCWVEAENLLAHERPIVSACSCGDHPQDQWCDCPFCVVFRLYRPPRNTHCPDCGDSLMAEGATEPSLCFRCTTDGRYAD